MTRWRTHHRRKERALGLKPRNGQADYCDYREHVWRDSYYGYQCQKCPMFFAYGSAPWEDFGEPPDGFDDEPDEFEYWLGECGKDRDGYCGKAGSEECEFECPFRA